MSAHRMEHAVVLFCQLIGLLQEVLIVLHAEILPPLRARRFQSVDSRACVRYNARMKRPQIIGTLGPSSSDIRIMAKMLEAGMDVARLNFSYGTHEQHGKFVTDIRETARVVGKKIPIIVDLSGPRAQTADGHTFDEDGTQITEKDLYDLTFARDYDIPWIAQSYVGTAEDVHILRTMLEARSVHARIIAKIERKEAISAILPILTASDGVMVARGDLGNTIPIEDVPFAEMKIVEKAHETRRSVIVATQMLYSMVENPEPTRAEVTDVAFAALIGADAVMLSDETARGKYPVESIDAMRRIMERAAKESEVHPEHRL